MSEQWPEWYCQVCGEADGENAENCCDCEDYRRRKEMDELVQRLEQASATLLEMQMEAYVDGRDDRSAHLKAKREGATLALSYIREG